MIVTIKYCLDLMCFLLQLLLERKSKEVGKLIEETVKSINDLTENISQAKVNSKLNPSNLTVLLHFKQTGFPNMSNS